MYVGQRKRLHKYLISVDVLDLVSGLATDLLFGDFVEDWKNDYSKKVGFVNIDMNSGDGLIVPYDIQQLKVYCCVGMRSLSDISGWEDVTDLEECSIWSCDEVESIFLSKSSQLETLEYLNLICLKNLKGIVGEPSAATFSCLKQICLFKCRKIKKLFSAKWVLHNMEVIEIRGCKEMEEIIASDSEEEGTGTIIKHSFPKLRKLKFRGLPELKGICSKNGVTVCGSIQKILIQDCPKLKRIPLYLTLLDNDHTKPSPPPPLKEIYVDQKEWWEALEWDHPHAINALLPFLKFLDYN